MDIARPLPRSALNPAQDRAIALAMLALWALLTTWQQWGHWPQDLSALYIAGHLWQTGRPELIYAAPPGFFGGAAASWGPVMAELGIGDRVTFPYVYPPLWAVLLGPVTAVLEPQGFADAVTLVQVPLLAASVLLAAHLMRPAAIPLWLWTLIGILILATSVQSYVALWHNQPTITVTFLILLAFVCLDADRPVAAGAALALAAAIKLTPAAFALIFLIDRRYRALAAFALIGGALGLLSLALGGVGLHLEFLDAAQAIRETALLNAVNISLLPALMAAGSALGLRAPFDTSSPLEVLGPVPGWLPTGVSLAAALLIVVYLATLRNRPGPVRRKVGLFALSLILALFGPLGWQHYYLMPLLLLPGLFGLLPRNAAALLAFAVALVSFRPTFTLVEWLPWTVANYVWISCAAWLAVLAGLHVAARRPA